jgi:RNA polymerase sigma factor (sigma-70 family)
MDRMSDFEPEIALLSARDDAEWLRVQREYQGRLYSFVQRRVRDRDACEDILQETFLGAIRGIGGFDPRYSFEQYLFGILRNRTIDHLRRQRSLQLVSQAEEGPVLEELVREEDTPATLGAEQELAERGRALLADVLREWVQETWAEREFQRLMVIEGLFSAGWRNREAWEKLQLRDQTTIAGIKFRALKRMRELTAAFDPSGECSAQLASSLGEDPGSVGIDVAAVWRRSRASCPARHRIARRLAGSLEASMAEFIDFHIDSAGCPWCAANRDDLSRRSREQDLESMFERVGASTMRLLRSRGELPP